MGATNELEETYALSSIKTLEEGVKNIIQYLGLQPCERSEKIPEGKSSHTLFLAGKCLTFFFHNKSHHVTHDIFTHNFAILQSRDIAKFYSLVSMINQGELLKNLSCLGLYFVKSLPWLTW